jgi:hypothetical protein
MPLAFNLLAPWGHPPERASSYLIELLRLSPAPRASSSSNILNPKFTGEFTAFDALIRYSDFNSDRSDIAAP